MVPHLSMVHMSMSHTDGAVGAPYGESYTAPVLRCEGSIAMADGTSWESSS